MRIGRVDVVETLKETGKEFASDRLSGFAAQSAYHLIFALPPLLIFFTALSALSAQYTGVDAMARLLDLARRTTPATIYQTIKLILDSAKAGRSGGVLSIGFVLAIWSGSGAVNVLIQGINQAYGITEGRNFIVKRALSIGLTIGLGILTISAFILFVFGQRLGTWVADHAGLGSTFQFVWSIARWPVILIFIVVSLAIFYWVGPAIRLPFRWMSPGAIAATIGWLAATFGFSLYLRFANPGSAYGALGAVIVLLFFLNISSMIFLFGAELNSVLDHELAIVPENSLAYEASKQALKRERRAERREAATTPSKGAMIAVVGSILSVFALGLFNNRKRKQQVR